LLHYKRKKLIRINHSSLATTRAEPIALKEVGSPKEEQLPS
jgi:hypothetical protein